MKKFSCTVKLKDGRTVAFDQEAPTKAECRVILRFDTRIQTIKKIEATKSK